MMRWTWKRRLAYVAAGILAVAVVLAAWAFWLEPASLVNEDWEITLPGWPPACSGLRVAVLADLHVGSPWNGLDKLERIVDLTLSARPDLVLLAGDYVIDNVRGGRFIPPEATAERLARLAAPLGVYAVLGNHDWWLDPARVERAFAAAGIPMLEDRAVALERPGCAFWLAGFSDYNEAPHDLDKALTAVPAGAPLLAFTHNPDVFPEVPARVHLTFAGHTHGGQVAVPFLGRPIVPSRYGERYAIGHIVEDGRHFFVSSGLGTSILPVRFRVPPEVSVVTIMAGG